MTRTLTAALAVLIATAAYAQTDAPRRYVVIGCISQQNAKSPFVLTDTRRDPPAVYRLDGDAGQLAPLVGQTVEIAGPIAPAADKQPPVVKVASVVRISTTCAKTNK